MAIRGPRGKVGLACKSFCILNRDVLKPKDVWPLKMWHTGLDSFMVTVASRAMSLPAAPGQPSPAPRRPSPSLSQPQSRVYQSVLSWGMVLSPKWATGKQTKWAPHSSTQGWSTVIWMGTRTVPVYLIRKACVQKMPLEIIATMRNIRERNVIKNLSK